MSNDEPDDDPRISDADRRVLRAAQTGEDCIEITSVDQLRELAAAAGETMRHFEDAMADMTQDAAAFARRLRVDGGYSWRAVAETCALEWGGDWGSNQLAGMAICERAAALHGENYMEDPWN